MNIRLLIHFIFAVFLCGCTVSRTAGNDSAQADTVDEFMHLIFTESPVDLEDYLKALSAEEQIEVSRRIGEVYSRLSSDDRDACMQALWLLDNSAANETLSKILETEKDPEISCNAANILIMRGANEVYDHYVRGLSVKTTWTNYDDKMAWLYCLAGLIQDMHMFDNRLIPVLVANIDADSEASTYFAAQCSTTMQLITNTIPEDMNVVMRHEWELEKSPQKVKETHDKWARWWEDNKATFQYQAPSKDAPKAPLPNQPPK